MRSWSFTTGDWTGTKSGCEGGGGGQRPVPRVRGELVGLRGRLRHRLQGLQAHEVGLPGQEQLTVRETQQGGRVGGVTGLLGGPERARLGQLPLPLLRERLGDGGTYLSRVGRGAGGRDEAAQFGGRLLGVPGIPGQLVVQGGDLSAQLQKGAQDGDAHGARGGRGDQQRDRHGAH